MSRRAGSQRARTLLALAVVAATGTGVACSGARPVADEPVDRLLVVSIPGASWADVRAGHLPHLAELASTAAIGDLSTRIGKQSATASEAYLTIGAGTRAVAPAVDGGLALEPDEPYGRAPASAVLLRRLGTAPDGIGYLTIGTAIDDNDASGFGAEVGLLGDALDDAGIARAVVANADGTEAGGDEPGYDRSAVTALMDHTGVVPAGSVDRSLLADDPAAPFGIELDPAAVLDAVAAAWGRPGDRTVVLVEASDVSRAAAYGTRSDAGQRRRLRHDALAAADALLASLLAGVDPDRDAVLVLSPVAPPGGPALGLVAVRAPGTKPGLVRSATTRRDGYVQLADVAPTVLELVGVVPPDDIEGRSFRVGGGGSANGQDRLDALADAADRARFRDDMVPLVSLAFVAVLALLVAAALLHRRLPTAVTGRLRGVAAGVLGAVPATYLANRFGVTGAPVAYLAFVVVVAGVVAAAAALAERHRAGTGLLVALGVIVAVLTVDVATGARLQLNTVFGYSVSVAGRFAGLGNLAFALLGAAAVLLAVLLAERFGDRGRRAGIAVLVAVALVDGLPFLGADVGGVASMVPAFGICALVLHGRRVGWRQLLAVAGAAVAAVLVFAFLDLARPPEARTHLARVAEHVLDLRWSPIADSIGRRWRASFGSTTAAAWVVLAAIVVAVGAHLAVVARRRAGRPLAPLADDDRSMQTGTVPASSVQASSVQASSVQASSPPIRAAAVGLGVLAVLGLVANDSSFAVPGTMLIVVVPAIVHRLDIDGMAVDHMAVDHMAPDPAGAHR